MISYERGIIFLTYPPIQAALPSAHRARWRRKKNWMRKNLQHSWRVYMVEKVNYLLHSYTTCHHVFYSYDSLLILFPTLWRSEFVSLRTQPFPPPPIMSYSLFSSFYDTIECWNYTEKRTREKWTQHNISPARVQQHNIISIGIWKCEQHERRFGVGGLVKVLNNTLFRLLSTA